MRSKLTPLIAAVILLFPSVGSAELLTDVCDTSNTLNILSLPTWTRATTVRNLLQNYNSGLTEYAAYDKGSHYAICFSSGPDPWMVSQSDLGTLLLAITADTTKDVYIIGLRIKSNPLDPITTEFLVTENAGGHNLVLRSLEFKNVKKGIRLSGAENTHLLNSVIEGDDSKVVNNDCIKIDAENALLDNVQASKCATGILVKADNVKIKNSKIWDNKIGIKISTKIEEGIERVVAGTDIESTKVYSNNDGDPSTMKRTDGIRIEDGISHEPIFLKTIEEEPIPVDEGESILSYNNETPYIYVNLPPGKTGRIDFYYSADGDCELSPGEYALNQACSLVMYEGSHMQKNLDGSELDEGPVYMEIPPAQLGKTLSAIYIDPDLGTSGITRQFSIMESSDRGIVAFVSNPYDIPTTGGATEAELEAGAESEIQEDTGGDQITVGGGAIEGGGAIVSRSAGCGGGGGSLTNNSFRNIVVTFNAWWVLLALSLAGAMRLATKKARTRK